MRTLSFMTAIYLIFISSNQVNAQYSSLDSTIHALYYYSVAYPEDFDESLVLDIVMLNPEEPLECLVRLEYLYFFSMLKGFLSLRNYFWHDFGDG